eukprot:TRINITY_DN9590_c0_g1_i1.p1 TRINITY_DN9590_c0_g1~~TRINITY_DN9590_c0_g1_i1.p1  ORF type:complete len:344 (+),score=60.19 TRINITY_DN9590_c0_g1_i1:402-1433(+)
MGSCMSSVEVDSKELYSRNPQKNKQEVQPEKAEELLYELKVFNYMELLQATSNFSDSNILGEGGFGKVYKGFVNDDIGELSTVGHHVAIKKLNPRGVQSQQEWIREIIYLGKLQHPNLVKLFGYCVETNLELRTIEMLLVYEYLQHGSLDYHLWPGKDTAGLPWQARVKIAADAAMGLAFLHSRNVIHRDFKASNILLGDGYTGKLTDFGLAKEGPDEGRTHVSTQIMGTLGYLDPRYAETGQLTIKSDVYAFGVVLLEMLTGKRAMQLSEKRKPVTLTAWVRPHLNKPKPDLDVLLDRNIPEPFPEDVARLLLTEARICIQEDKDNRPSMKEVVEILQRIRI